MLTVGLPVLLAVGGVCAWLFLPRIPLPPEKNRNVLDVASNGRFATFGDTLLGRWSGRLFSGGVVWEIPGGKSIAQGLSSYGILSPDGEHVIIGGASILDLRTKKSVSLESPPLPGPIVRGYSSQRFSNHGGLIANVRNGWLYLLDAQTGKVLHLLNNQMRSQDCGFISTGFSPDDKVLAAGDAGGNIMLWDVKEGELKATLTSESSTPCSGPSRTPTPWLEVWSVSYSPDGKKLVSDDSSGIVRVWDVGSRKLLRTIPFQLGRGGVRFTPDGKFVVSTSSMPLAGTPGAPQQWIIALSFIDPTTGTLVQALVVPGFAGLAFSGSGNMLLATILNERLKVDEWTLGHEIRLPFTSPPPQPLLPSGAAVTTAYEDHAINHLQQLQIELSKYKNNAEHAGFPGTLQDLAKSARIDEGPIREEIHGYRYSYTPAPADAQGNIPGYTISATPLAYRQTGNSSFLVNQSGEVHATTDHREAAVTDPVVRTLPDATQLAAGIPTTAAAAGEQQPVPAQSATPVMAAQPSGASVQRVQDIAAANQWVAQAETQFQRGNYRDALQNCEAALRLDPANARAVQLKTKIEETMRILGKN